MNDIETLVVGTDGSATSLRAVARAGTIAADFHAKLIIAMAYFPGHDDLTAEDVLKDEGYMVHGNAAIYAILREAHDRAKAVGATNIEVRLVQGGPVKALCTLAKEVKADLLVIGNVGLGTRSERWLGSVPSNILHKAKTDVLIVHTTD